MQKEGGLMQWQIINRRNELLITRAPFAYTARV